MNLILLYLLLLKATITTFNGLASLPIIRQDLVIERKVLTDSQLTSAIAATQATPGPLGLYVVGVGYYVAGVPGACAGCLALITPAFVILPLLKTLASRADSPALRGAVQGITLAAAGLIVYAVLPIARTACAGPLPTAIAVGAGAFLILTNRDTLWVIVGSAAVALLGRTLHLL